MYSPARPPASSHVRSSQCPEMHGPDLHAAEEPLGRGVVRAAPLRAHGPDQAVPAHPVQPSRPPVVASAVAVRPRDARRHAAWRRPGPGIVSRRFRVRRRPGAQRRLDPPIPVSAPRFAEHVRDAAAQGPVLIDPRSRVAAVVAAGRDTAARRPSTSANTSASAGRPASPSPCSTGAAGRRPGLFTAPNRLPHQRVPPTPAPVSARAAHPGHRPAVRDRFRPEAWHPLYLFNGLCAGLSRVCWPCYR